MSEVRFRLRLDNKVVGYEKWYPGERDYEKPDTEQYPYWVAHPCWLYSTDGQHWAPTAITHNQKDRDTDMNDRVGTEIWEKDTFLYTIGGDKKPRRFVVQWDSGRFIGFARWHSDKTQAPDVYDSPVVLALVDINLVIAIESMVGPPGEKASEYTPQTTEDRAARKGLCKAAMHLLMECMTTKSKMLLQLERLYDMALSEGFQKGKAQGVKVGQHRLARRVLIQMAVIIADPHTRGISAANLKAAIAAGFRRDGLVIEVVDEEL